uniref:Uncharacterized protein n=1 Tax=Oryza sativa subsp. japonica TaxID=39947 RepID=Q6K1S3_ORYSJ|nr:hypothetical protein [Oryza sativa Japonica Group]
MRGGCQSSGTAREQNGRSAARGMDWGGRGGPEEGDGERVRREGDRRWRTAGCGIGEARRGYSRSGAKRRWRELHDAEKERECQGEGGAEELTVERGTASPDFGDGKGRKADGGAWTSSGARRQTRHRGGMVPWRAHRGRGRRRAETASFVAAVAFLAVTTKEAAVLRGEEALGWQQRRFRGRCESGDGVDALGGEGGGSCGQGRERGGLARKGKSERRRRKGSLAPSILGGRKMRARAQPHGFGRMRHGVAEPSGERFGGCVSRHEVSGRPNHVPYLVVAVKEIKRLRKKACGWVRETGSIIATVEDEI